MDEPLTPAHVDVDASLDRYARLAQRLLGVPIALVSFVEEDRQWFPGAVGLTGPLADTRETPLSHSFCKRVVADRRPLVVTDARDDDRVRDNPAITELGIVAYAGYPITDYTGTVIGSLCAIANEPRSWDDRDLEALADLAGACSTELAQRGLRLAARTEERRARDLTHRSRVLLALSEGLAETITPGDIAEALNRISKDYLGCLLAGIWLLDEQRQNLDYIVPGAVTWESAERYARVSVDDANPLATAVHRPEPFYYSSRAEQNEVYEHLAHRKQVGESRAFVPLRAQGRVFGTLVLLWEEVREVPDEHRITLAALASYTTQALQRALHFQDRMGALVTLQNSLMPRLPKTEHLQLAARYMPAASLDQVGGDWYDAVLMPGGEMTLMIGDVIGHDIAAAAKMGQLRSILRAFALATDEPPSDQVSRLDQALIDLDVGGMATLIQARLRSEGDLHHLQWTNAGHPPPLLIDQHGAVRWLDSESPDILVGVGAAHPRTDHEVTIPAGSTLLLYTDGLVERRGESVTAGLERLAVCAGKHHGLPPEEFLDAVLGELLDARLGDDVAVLAVRFTPTE